VAEEVLLVVVSKAVVFQAENQALEVTEIVEIANQQEAEIDGEVEDKLKEEIIKIKTWKLEI
jgi:hypothetical protein